MGGEFSLLVLDDGEVPTAATNLAGKVTAPGKVTIAWDAATGIDPIAKYAIWRGQETEWGRDFDELPFAIVDGSTLSCVDSGCIPGTTNYYRVMAVDAKGDAGPFSEGVGVAVP
jgi:hypothetical protein